MTARQAPPCPCGGASRVACCGPLLAGDRPADSAEALMRSRYTAWVEGDLHYLLQTWHAATRPERLLPEPGLRWLGLSVRRVEAGRPGDRHGMVEFVARSKRAGRAHRLHERSRFVFEQGRWWYVDGDIDPR